MPKNSCFIHKSEVIASKMSQLEVKKMKQGMSYSCKEKTIILNVFKYFRSQYPDKCVTEIVRRTAKATGCSEKSIFHFRKEEVSPGGFKEPCKTKIRKNININSRFIKYDGNVRQAIKNIIYDLKYKNIIPSINVIRRTINNDNSLPNFSSMTLRRLLFDMGFYYEKNGTKSILVEKDGKNEIRKENLPLRDKKIENNKATREVPQAQNQMLEKKSKTQNIPIEHIPQTQPSLVIQHMPTNNHIYQPIQHHIQKELPMSIPQQDGHVLNPIYDPHVPIFNHRAPQPVSNMTVHNFGMQHNNGIIMQQI